MAQAFGLEKHKLLVAQWLAYHLSLLYWTVWRGFYEMEGNIVAFALAFHQLMEMLLKRR